MRDAAFERRKATIKAVLAGYLGGCTETGLTDVKRALSNHFKGRESLVDSGLFVAKMLNAVGWQRDGFLYTGYDRTPRYVPVEGSNA